MADPLSITASCLALLTAVVNTSKVVTGFIRDVREARGDLDAVSRELSSLTTILELLKEDATEENSTLIPKTLKIQITGILVNCKSVVSGIRSELDKHDKSRVEKIAYWTMGGGKGEMAKLRSTLEAHKTALDIALDLLSITIIRDVKKDTAQILEDAAAIKDDTAQILEEIARLQSRLPEDATEGRSNEMLQRYLDSLTSYAGTVRDLSTEDDVDSFWSPEATSRSQSFEEARSSFSFALLPEQTEEIKKEGATSTERQGGLTETHPAIATAVITQEQNRDTGKIKPQSLNKLLNDRNNQTAQQDNIDLGPNLNRDKITTNQTSQLRLLHELGIERTRLNIPLASSSPSILETYAGPGIPDLRITTKADHKTTQSQYAFQTNSSSYLQERTHQARSASDSGITTSSGSSSTPVEAGKQEANIARGCHTVECRVDPWMRRAIGAGSDHESRFYRYTAFTHLPSHPLNTGYTLRPYQTDVLIIIEAPEETYWETVSETLRSIARNIASAKGYSWEHFAVCIVKTFKYGHGGATLLHDMAGVSDGTEKSIGLRAALNRKILGNKPAKAPEKFGTIDDTGTQYMRVPSRDGSFVDVTARASLVEYTYKPYKPSFYTPNNGKPLHSPMRLLSLEHGVKENRERLVFEIGRLLKARTCICMDCGDQLEDMELSDHCEELQGYKGTPDRQWQYAGLPAKHARETQERLDREKLASERLAGERLARLKLSRESSGGAG